MGYETQISILNILQTAWRLTKGNCVKVLSY